jgi:hypothetical protein
MSCQHVFAKGVRVGQTCDNKPYMDGLCSYHFRNKSKDDVELQKRESEYRLLKLQDARKKRIEQATTVNSTDNLYIRFTGDTKNLEIFFLQQYRYCPDGIFIDELWDIIKDMHETIEDTSRYY